MAKKRLMIGIGILAIIIILVLIYTLGPSQIIISKTQVDPIKVAPGKYLTLLAEIKSTEEIQSVYAEIPYEGGVDKIDMEKIASKGGKDIFQAKWITHGTANLKWYTANITAIDVLGNKAFSSADFQDPTVNHTWPQIQEPNGCLISSTLSSCPAGYSADTRYDGRFASYTYQGVDSSFGTATHNHSTYWVNPTGVGNEGAERGSSSNPEWLAWRLHTHEVTITHVSTENHIPLYTDFLICCRNP